MTGCAVYGCNNYSRKTKGSDVRYYSFPKNKDLSKQWVNACHRQDKINVQNAFICSKHFHPSAFIRTLKHELLKYRPKCFRDLKQDAIPTEFLPNQKQSLSTDKSERCQKRDEIKNRSTMIGEILEKVEDVPDQIECTEHNEKESSSTSPAFMEPSTSEFAALIDQLKIDNANLRKQNEILQQNLTSANTELESMKTMLKKQKQFDDKNATAKLKRF